MLYFSTVLNNLIIIVHIDDKNIKVELRIDNEMDNKPFVNVEYFALKKLKIYRDSVLRFLLRAIMASMFIGFGVIVAFKSSNFFHATYTPFAYPMAAITITVAILLIAYGGADLFIGNIFYFAYTAIRGRMNWLEVLNLWLITYIGNILGAGCFSLLIHVTGLYNDPTVKWISFCMHQQANHIIESF